MGADVYRSLFSFLAMSKSFKGLVMVEGEQKCQLMDLLESQFFFRARPDSLTAQVLDLIIRPWPGTDRIQVKTPEISR